MGQFFASPARAAKSSSDTASSTRRRWSSSVSVLRVTFSVARIVRSATSARISWIARRVSVSMSLRACSSSSSRRRRPSATASASCCSPALRARATISSACWRAAVRRSRYSPSSRSASRRVRSAVSIDSSIAFWRRSSASPIRGKATFQRMNIDTPKRTSVHTISPMPGLTRKLPPSSSPPASVAKTSVLVRVASIGLLEEERDQARDEAVEEARLGECEAEPLDAGDLVAHLGLARHGLDDLAEDDADADAGAHGAEATANTEGDRLARVRAVLGGGEDEGEEGCEHWRGLLVGLVVLGDRAAEVDGRQGGEDERLQGGHEADLEGEQQDAERQREDAE